jgi:hypothetical protein
MKSSIFLWIENNETEKAKNSYPRLVGQRTRKYKFSLSRRVHERGGAVSFALHGGGGRGVDVFAAL